MSDSSPSDPLAEGVALSDGESELSQLRQNYRLLNNDARNLRQKYEFNLVFTKQLEAENFSLREKLDEAAQAAGRREEALSETRDALEAHRTLLANMERAKVVLEQEVSSLREDAASRDAVAELERKRAAKQAFELEKLRDEKQSLQHVRNASSKAQFREGLEEMRRNLGSLRFQRRLQEENARVGLVARERDEALIVIQGLQTTMAEQQRILNELQREKLLRVGETPGSARGERMPHSPLAPLSPAVSRALPFSLPTSPASGGVPLGGSLLDDMEEEDAEAMLHAGETVAASTAAPAAVNGPQQPLQQQQLQQEQNAAAQLAQQQAAIAHAAAQQQQVSQQEALLHAEQLESVRQQLHAAQAQLQSSRSSRVQSETSLLAAQEAVKKLEASVAAKDAALTTAQAAATEAVAKVRADGDARAAELSKQVEQLKQEHETTMSSLREQHQRATAALNEQHKELLTSQKDKLVAESSAQLAQQVAFLQKQHATAVAQQDAQHKASLAALQVQLDTAIASAKDTAARAAVEIASLQKTHATELGQVQADATRNVEALRAKLDAARAATSTAEAALLAARQAARDHVCAVPQSAAAETQMLQSSLSSAQALSRALEQQVADLQRAAQEEAHKLSVAESQAEEALSIAERREAHTAKQAADTKAELERAQTQITALQQANFELITQHTSLQSSLRQNKASSDELTLQLSSLQSHLESVQESSTQQNAQLSKLVEHWQAECEKRKQAAETTRKEAAKSTEELERRIRELEQAIASHVCAASGNAGQAMGQAGNAANIQQQLAIHVPSPSPSPSPAAIAVTHVKPALGSPLTTTGVLTAVPSSSASTATPPVVPAAAPAVVVSSAFAKDGLSAAHVLEIHAYASFVSRSLGSDPDLKHLFPLDVVPAASLAPLPPVVRDFAGCGMDLLRKLRDGLLLAKLINIVSPGCIDERVLNKRGGGGLGKRDIMENLNVVVTSAKCLGITMRVPQDDIAEGAEGEEEQDEGSSTTPRKSRVSIGGAGEGSPMSSASPSRGGGGGNLLTSPTVTSSNYVGVELGNAQLVLMQCDTSLENLDIVLDFFFQLLRNKMLYSAFGPEKSKVARLADMLRLPKLPADTHKAMLARTLSLMPGMEASSPKVTAAAAGKPNPFGGTRRFGARSGSKGTLSKFATLSKALPVNLSSAEHKKFVGHFTTAILADYEQTSDLNALTPEQLLLRWINWTLIQQVTVSTSGPLATLASQAHYVAHLSDMDVTSYTLLLARVDAWRAEHHLADASIPAFDIESASSASVLAYLQAPLNVPHFHSAASVATRHERLNELLVALLFRTWPLMEAPAAAAKTITLGTVRRLSAGHERMTSLLSSSASASILSGSSSSSASFVPPEGGLSDEEGEASILKSYLNSCGIPHVQINHLFTDVRTGLVLLRMLDWLEPGCVDWKSAETNPSNKFKCISNLNLFLQLVRERLRLPFVNIGAVDVYSEHNSKYVLAIIWQLLRYNTIAKLKQIRNDITHRRGEEADHKEITDQSILDWANAKVKGRPHPMAAAHNAAAAASWSDASLRSSLFLLNLLDNVQQGCVDWSAVEEPPSSASSAADSNVDLQQLLLRNARYAISVCRKLGAELFALPQDIVSANRKQLVLVLASIMVCEYALEEAEE